MIYYCSADGNGVDSVRNILKNHPKDITHIDASSFRNFDDKLTEAKFQGGDTLIVDTISALAATIRREHRFKDLKEGESLSKYYQNWDKTNSQSAYAMAEQLVMQKIKAIGYKGVNIIVTAHEGEQINEKTLEKTVGPELSPKFFNRLSESCSAMFRLKIEYTQIADENGKVKSKEKRILMIRPVEDYILKCHAPMEELEKIPYELVNPTLPKLYAKLGFVPSFMVVYSPPGGGKSTFALSQFTEEKK